MTDTHPSRNAVVADIGGTHIRIAALKNGALQSPQKYPCANFSGLEEALAAWIKESGIEEKTELLIAAAANLDDKGLWRFKNRNSWTIDTAALEKAGWRIALMANDFEACAHGVLAAQENSFTCLRKNLLQDTPWPRAVLGPGTGLGLGYMIPMPDGNWHVLRAKGGHMVAAAVTDEQRIVLEIIARLRGGEGPTVYEDAISGANLPRLYHALCIMHGQDVLFSATEEMLQNSDNRMVGKALRLFHEFLGLFAHNVAVTASAYGGLYLAGGLMIKLHESGLFDFDAFSRAMDVDIAPTVKALIGKTPIYLLSDPFIALHGLAAMYRDGRST